MKCAACGYERTVEIRSTEKVVRYKSGVKKGQIKEVVPSKEVFEVGHRDFIRLEFEKEVDRIGEWDSDYSWRAFDEKDIYVCPECGTLKIEV